MNYGNFSCPFNSLLTNNLSLSKITMQDFETIKPIFQDPEVMYEWEHTLTDEEVKDWMVKVITRHAIDKFCYLIVRERTSGNCIGVAGPLIEDVNGIPYYGVACILKKEYWRKGYASQAISGIITLLVKAYGIDKVIACISQKNEGAIALAKHLGMRPTDSLIKTLDGKAIEHIVYSILAKECE